MTSPVFYTQTGAIATITLNRPGSHNAFDAGLIRDLDETLAGLQATKPRALILTGAGATFSAGADLNWMRAMAQAGEHDNFADACGA